MHDQNYAKPWYIFFLVLPYGISFGFVTVTLPYLLTHNGFSVEMAADIVALGVSANLWRFLWGPVADITLSLRRWFWIGIISCVATLLLLCMIPFEHKYITILTVIVFISQVASTLILLPVGGFMAHRIEDHRKGMASGWFQAGNLGGVGLGGGAGLWLSVHFTVFSAGAILSLLIILSSLVVLWIKDVPSLSKQTLRLQMKEMGKTVLSMLRVPAILAVIILIWFPIGSGGASNVWSAVAGDWKVSADTVALVTGIISGLVSALGCITGGFIADKWGVWYAYLTTGAISALVALVMAALPFTPMVYITGVLVYSFALGMINAAFSAIILFAIGKKAAATKYSLLSSLGNIPVVYMTSLDGWVHDHGGSRYMLVVEALAGLLSVAIFLIVFKWMRNRKFLVKPADE